MTRAEKIELFKQVKSAVTDLLTSTFDKIDREITEHTYTNSHDQKIVKASKVRLALKVLRSESLSRIKQIGAEYEGDSNE